MEKATAQRAWNERYSTSELDWDVEPNQFVASRLRDVKPGRAIDLGAGRGRNAAWLASQGWEVTAVDFSSIALDQAARLATKRGVSIEAVVADATAFQPLSPVDLVLISYLQLDPTDRRIVLGNAKTWIGPGGTVFVIGHDRSNVANGYGGPESPDVCYKVEETVATLSGLEITTAEVIERVAATATGDQVALDTLVIANRPPD